MFRGKESSNRIELSQLVQDLLNFGVLGSLWLWGWGVGCMGVGGCLGVPPTHVHMHMHARTCKHAHIYIKHDNFNCKWQPPLGESLGIPYYVIHVHACMYVHVNVCRGHPFTTPTPIHPLPTPQGGPPESVKIQ